MLKNTITIVVPCKNEENYIGHLLDHLKKQKGIEGVQIYIADASTDNTRNVIKEKKGDLKVEVIQGGPVSEAKNNGAALAKTPYILFIDSDVRFFSDTVIYDTVTQMEKEDLDLIGLNIKCYDDCKRSQFAFSMFNVVNNIMARWMPFAVGAYMLTRRDKFEEFNGFPCKYPTSEDFFLSKMYDPKKFRIAKHYFGQDSRRFKQMGYFGMISYLIKNFLNRNNEKHWENIDAKKYWSS
jgi:glycosyltransferase involved in cell wall biosynthesis